jgi:hypothetical protein
LGQNFRKATEKNSFFPRGEKARGLVQNYLASQN